MTSRSPGEGSSKPTGRAFFARLWHKSPYETLRRATFLSIAACSPTGVDLLYRDKRIAIEYDGIQHGETHDYDSRRQNLLFLAGYRVLRFTAPDVFRMPMAVVGTVRSCLNAPVE